MKRFSEESGLKTIYLRFFNVYGQRQAYNQYGGVISRFVESTNRNESLTVFGTGRQTRYFVHIRDVVEANILALQSNLGGEVFSVATGIETEIKMLAELLLDLTNKPKLKIVYSDPRKGDVE